MSETAAAFDALCAEFFAVWFRYHPDSAIQAGVPGYEHLLPAQSDDELAALAGWLETLIIALEELDYDGLDPERQIDLRLMFGAARVEHRELLERDWRHRDPLRFLPVGEIYRLTLMQLDDLRDPLVRLLKSVPEYLRLALAHLRPMAGLIPAELAAGALDEAERGRCYLRELVRSPWLRRNFGGLGEIQSLADQACAALAAFGDGLRGEIAARARGRLGCGEQHLRFLLNHRHFLESDPAPIRSTLTEGLEACREGIGEICGRMGIKPDNAWRHLGEQRVESGDRLDCCRRESERLHAFLRQAGLFSLPEADLRVRERPACPRPQRFGCDYVADPEARHGTFFIRASGATDAKGSEPRSLLRARCLAGTWGGSHLLSFAAGEAGRRLPRRLCTGGGFAPAWGRYLRERLCELGYLGAEDRLLDQLQRFTAFGTALVDLDLHLGAIDAPEARERLAELPGTHPADLIHLARHPGAALAGVLGFQAIKSGRARSAVQEGAGRGEAGFHDRLLGRGPIPLALGVPPDTTGTGERRSGTAAS